MAKGWKLYNILLWTSWALIPVWVPVSKFFPHTSQKEYEIARKILASDSTLIFLIIVFIGSNIWKRASEDNTHKRNLEKYLELLHEKYFPHEDGGKHHEYRITLFVPNWWNQLEAYAKSGNPPLSGTNYSIKKSENAVEKKDYDGIVGRAWGTGVFVAIDNLPDYDKASPFGKEQYAKEIFLSKKKCEKLKWRSRSYRCLVIKNKIGEKVGVLVMESQMAPQGLNKVTAGLLTETAKTLQCFF